MSSSVMVARTLICRMAAGHPLAASRGPTEAIQQVIADGRSASTVEASVSPCRPQSRTMLASPRTCPTLSGLPFVVHVSSAASEPCFREWFKPAERGEKVFVNNNHCSPPPGCH